MLIVFASFWALACGGVSMQQNPASTVTVEITGISSEVDRDAVKEKLKGMTDGSSHSITTMWSGGKMTVTLSPVTDVKKFAAGLDFGEVTEVDGRTVNVAFKE